MNYLKTNMFEHQEKAFNKIKKLKACALFMDMGTGKTRTMLEYIQLKLNQGKINKVFWICPCSTKKNLREDIFKHSIFSSNYVEKIKDELIVIIGTETISQSNKFYIKTKNLIEKYPHSLLIIDESHMIKNHRAIRTRRILDLGQKTAYRAILTGTPVTQGIWDLFTQFYFLHPKILGYNSFYAFAANHLEYSEKYPGQIINTHNTDYITKKINPYIYQVTKKECLDLPPKTYTNRYFDFDNEQYEIYQTIKNYYVSQINYDNFNGECILNMINALYRVASGYIDIELNPPIYHEREIITHLQYKGYERAIETITQLSNIPSNSKCIIWHRYNSDLKLLSEKLNENDIKYVCVNGEVSQSQRELNINDFKTSSDINVLVANINIGNVGLNLQEANYMIYYNSTFEYAKRKQSEDRIYRIGQNKNCHIIDILSNSGIDDMVENNICNKTNLIRDIRNKINEIKDDKEKIEEFKQKILDEY